VSQNHARLKVRKQPQSVALAHAGYGTQFTGEDEGDNLADAPVERIAKLTIEEAHALTTPKGTPLGNLTRPQIEEVIKKSKDSKIIEACKLILSVDFQVEA
jgi:hypothetical protein